MPKLKCLSSWFLSLLALIFLTTCEIQSGACDTYYVLTASANTCPESFTWDQCITLERFASIFSTSQTQNILLILESGTHSLTTTRISLPVTHTMQNFTMVPADPNTNSHPRIACNTGSNRYNEDIRLVAVSHIQIQGVSFEGCLTAFGTSSVEVTGNNVLISDVSFTTSELTIRNIVESVQLLRVNFTDCTLSHIETFIESTRIRMDHVIITRQNGIETSKAAEITVTDIIVQDTTASAFILINSPNVSVSRSHFMNNNAGGNNLGGGLYMDSVNAVVNESVFYNNQAFKGSGIGVRFSANLTVDRCNFTFNDADLFGAISSEGFNLTVTNSVFVSNTAQYGAGIGAIALNMFEVSNCSFVANDKQAIYTRLGDNVVIARNNFSQNSGSSVLYGGGAIAIDRTLTVTVIQGLFISNSVSGEEGKGGAISMEGGNLLTLWGCNFISNYASLDGGAVHTTGSSLRAWWNYFTNNIASNSGGALSIYSDIGYGSVNMTHCRLTGNRASMAAGGAIHVNSQHTAVNIDNSNFTRNMASFGGAIHQEGQFTNISLTDCMFDSNSATLCGVVDIDDIQHRKVEFIRSTFISNRATGIGATDGGGVLCVSGATISMTDCTFKNNSVAQNGGVLKVDDSDIRIDRCLFIQNVANRMGSVAYTDINPATYSVRLSTFLDNSAGGDGGVLFLGIIRSRVNIERSSFGSNSAGNRGGMVAINGSQLVIDNQTNIYENTAAMGPAISACTNSEVVTSSELTLTGTDTICKYYSANINTFNISEFILEELSTTTMAEIITTSPNTTMATTERPTTQESTVTVHSSHTNHTTPGSPTSPRETEETSEKTPTPWTRPSDKTTTPPIGTVDIPLSEPSTQYGKMALAISIVSLVLTLCLFVLVGVYIVAKMILMLARRRGVSITRDSDSTELLMEAKT